jgi:hypothetical protein
MRTSSKAEEQEHQLVSERVLQEISLTTGRKIMDYTENESPMFNGHNGLDYEIWSGRTKVFLQAHGYDV